MQVLKFGGTSLADARNILKATEIIRKAVDVDRTIVVASAIAGCTDELINVGRLAADHDESYKDILDTLQDKHHQIIKELLPVEKHEESLASCDDTFDSIRSIAHGVFLLSELSRTSLDAIQGCGELMSSRILATKLASIGISTAWVDSTEVIRTHGAKNTVDFETTYANVEAMIENNPIKDLFIVPGFIAGDDKGRMVTLGRGGSDYSASLYAVGSKARSLETWKDVPGMMTADPKIVPSATLIRNISYRAALELSHFGAKVIYPPTIQPVVAERIPIYVKCTFDPDGEGTIIEQNPPKTKNRNKIIGISNSDKIALLSLEGSDMVGGTGFSYRLFQTLSENEISIILITQASSVNTMCVAVAEKDAEKAKEAVDKCFAYEISLGKVDPLKVETGYSIVCLVGDDIFGQRGTMGRMLAALGRRSIGVRAVAEGSSERNISVIVKSSEVRMAIKMIHDEFFTKSSFIDINLFIAGYGTVGKALVDIIARNRDKIAQRTGKRIHIAGISNSRRFVIDRDGIDPGKIAELLAEGQSAANEGYFEALAKTSLQNSIFVDCTASSDISYKYLNLFSKGYSVVASNKITFASPYEQYKTLKEAAVENGVSLKYETTVGAALPILESISRSVNSGDEIRKVEAVLSGTMNFIFSSYKGGEDGRTFADIVKYAKEAGYSEPDPRLDLSGRDVLRKLLILSREAGVAIDEKDVEIDSVLGPEFLTGKVSEFFEKLAAGEEGFAKSYKAAAAKGKRQRFVASLVKDPTSPNGYKASMGLQEVGPENPLFNLCGTDNAAIITTEFYPSPLVVQGAGAGAYQTASGVLNDILI